MKEKAIRTMCRWLGRALARCPVERSPVAAAVTMWLLLRASRSSKA